MNNRHKIEEQISAFADGELEASLHDSVLSDLRTAESFSIWENYHRIGDVLRFNDTASGLSTDFSSRMIARLSTEPVHLKLENAPVAALNLSAVPRNGRYDAVRRLAVPGAAIAATLVLAFSNGLIPFEQAHTPASVATVSTGSSATTYSTAPASIAASTSSLEMPAMLAAVARDARMDDYLSAHQRFSQSLYTVSHYARFSNSANE